MLFNTQILITFPFSTSNIYKETPKDVKILGVIASCQKSSISSDLINLSARLLVRQWEKSSNLEVSSNVYHNLILFISKLTMSIRPTLPTFLTSLYYSYKIYKTYGNRISGGDGCSFRVFTISLMIACKYLSDGEKIGINDHYYWAAHTLDMFRERDVEKMELEMLSFLKYNIRITMSDLQWFKECVLDASSISLVPDNNGNNWLN